MRLSSDPAARRRLALLLSAALVAFAAGLAVGAGGDDGETEPPPAEVAEQAQEQRRERALAAVDRLTLRQQVGQLIVSSFPDPAPPGYIRRRLRARETAGVILFGHNAGSEAEWRRLTRAVQRHARGTALVMVDQEGGEIRTVSWAGPAAGQPAQGDAAAVRTSARQTGRQLGRAGVNVNLAPVADVPGGAAPVMGFRAFDGDPNGIAARTRASIEGLRSEGVAATAKHFPGLGRAQVNTDDGSALVAGPLTADLVPFRAAVEAGAPLVMLSHALYPELDANRIASQSRAIVTGLLRGQLGFDGVIVTDSMEAQAVLDRSGVARAAERSLRAGVNLILTTGSASWNLIHPWLLREARESPAFRKRVRESAARILALKELLR
ncbi:MAG TPA: glycoside hydrolase family 3 N-terminal domain-containing protein [Thermoleophilaceae bacterium]|nr:glycoside hydrolase family 3 N-terminal domain-containing protein [Thermoleophilaceae bacterium]